MIPINLSTDLLRTFVTVSDLGSYTRAGEALNRTQPAISLQMRRLEELVGAKLIAHDGRILSLTEAGQVLSAYARQILHLNDQAVSQFRRDDVVGALKVGLPTDFAVLNLQETVARFVFDHPDVDLEIRCGLSRELVEALHADEISLAVALIPEDKQQYLVRAWEERPIWVTAKSKRTHSQKPLPLVGHPEGCEYRNRMTKALERVGSKWRIAYTSPDVSGLQKAVVSGLGVSALTRSTLSNGMRVLSEADGFPEMDKIRIGMFYKHPRLSKAGLELSNGLIANLDKATDRFFTQSAHP